MLVAPLHAFDPTNIPRFETTLVRAELQGHYTLFEGGARGARIRGADAMADAARWSAEATEAELLEQVTTAYLGVSSGREILTAARRQVSALEAERDRAERHRVEGTAPRLEVLRAEAALLDARAQATTAEVRTDLAERTLARLTGLDADTVRARGVAEVILDGSRGPDALVHPAVERGRRAVDGARARLDQERAALLPTVSASAALLDYGAVGSGHVAEWQAGLRVSWPVFTGGARGAGIRRAQAELRTAEEELRLTRLRVDDERDAAEATRTAAAAKVQALQAAVEQWEEVARIEALSLDEGVGVQSDLLRAQAGLFRARAGLAQSRADLVVATVRVARARGALSMEWMDSALETTR
jgi:outer membrane protein TolC